MPGQQAGETNGSRPIEPPDQHALLTRRERYLVGRGMPSHWHVAHQVRMLSQFAAGPDDHLVFRLADIPDNEAHGITGLGNLLW